jgi:hypothetical protein
MKIGMLWFDNDKQTDLATKIQHAADYYQNNYGLRPNLCYVHPTMTPKSNDGENEEKKEEKVLKAGSVLVRTSKTVLPNHIWIGVNGLNGQPNP